MQDILFIHNQRPYSKRRFTAAIRIPAFEALSIATMVYLRNPTEEPVSLSLEFGMAACAESDQFCRKIGRDLALPRMKTTKFDILRLEANQTTINVFLYTKEYDLEIRLLWKRTTKVIRAMEVVKYLNEWDNI